MAKDRLSGKLAVILHADVAGSTELVQQDEQLAHERIHDAFRRFSETIEKYQGHILELRGDALLAQFERASDAVTATLAFQADHTYLISRLKDDLRPTIRVGIAMGEVVIADSTVTGAGVVLAQRIEQQADPGGVCITAALHEALPKRMPFDLENMGEQVLKGFDDPVRVYRVELSADQSIPLPEKSSKGETSQSKPRLLVATIVTALVVAGGAAYWFKTQEPREEAASIERMAFPLPDKPSIAVLPFTNMSDDAQQEYFADGMTEDLITDISKVNGLFVIARNSVFTYKGKAVEVRRVAEELGVRYVMEGSVRRVGNQVRINAQLIDATTGGHVWADRYDGSLDDVLSMQDKISREIVNALAVNLVVAEQDQPVKGETRNSEAYDAYLLGWERYRSATPDDLRLAVTHFESALELDPNYSSAHTALTAVYWKIISKGWWYQSLNLSSARAIELTRLSIVTAMKQPSALTHQVVSERSAFFDRKPDKALAEAEQAISMDVNDPAGYLAMATALLKADRPAEAIKSLRSAMRLDPHFPPSYLARLGQAQFLMAQYQDAVVTLKQSIARNSQDDQAFIFLAAAYGQLGQKQDAINTVSKANALRRKVGWDDLTLADIRKWRWVGDHEGLREGLTAADVPLSYAWGALIKRSGNEFSVEGATEIDVEMAKKMFDFGMPFIDVSRAFFQEHIPGAHHLMWYRGTFSQAIPRDFNEVQLLKIANKPQGLVIYDTAGGGDEAAASAYAVLRGFQKIYYLRNGVDKWKTAGYPVESGQ